ncbi:hypothetical protein RPMA_19960 [Tardiphaga alba]|uniref:Ogr/Delta-like zinc finger protein n=1 Tax=Tardiphaga alba TaxID=340268 RepID=A0ABX8AAQ9_9BRAD|nr:hypothetical protein [Tardiphaga alba]QUS40859.1 hypothetical protein RPMA_19960 [Tardiphaga alba]
MISSSLVPCPTCHQRREFVSVEATGPKKDGAEIRTFACRPCEVETRYILTRHSVMPLAS